VLAPRLEVVNENEADGETAEHVQAGTISGGRLPKIPKPGRKQGPRLGTQTHCGRRLRLQNLWFRAEALQLRGLPFDDERTQYAYPSHLQEHLPCQGEFEIRPLLSVG